jgi:hypothetical protein
MQALAGKSKGIRSTAKGSSFCHAERSRSISEFVFHAMA